MELDKYFNFYPREALQIDTTALSKEVESYDQHRGMRIAHEDTNQPVKNKIP